ncbi:hypothetical protein BT96DRAFT_1020189 [Gymnopus androsaceus JB14]|uniref:Uncharacterized protein n=1 Tax=Gymnopus androsaceus JB14 TaxID=1447944 RepID=A0A6A4HJT0_9AGAR|nr:hypothetical protein BT96DRAFT_1020189 [Gymnopus androsaceus JB14]
MVDVVSIVVAALALLGTIAQAALSAWFGIYSEGQKRKSALQSTFSKYHDPLHIAADDLSSKLINLIDYGFASLALNEEEPELQAYAITHTCFVFAQFFAWAHIFRRDTVFLRPHTTTGSPGAEVILLLSRIREVLRSGHTKKFRILSGIQSAIGEISTIDSQEGDGQLRCIGYAAFCEKWTTDPSFRAWFRPITDGLYVIAQNLVDVLDPGQIHSAAEGHCRPGQIAQMCICNTAKRTDSDEEKSFGRSSYIGVWLIKKVKANDGRIGMSGFNKCT